MALVYMPRQFSKVYQKNIAGTVDVTSKKTGGSLRI